MKSKQKTSVEQNNSDKKQIINIFYRPPSNAQNIREVVVAPVGGQVSQAAIVNLGSGGDCSSCVLAGTLILMADGSTRPIETFVGGEMVKTMTGKSRVISLDKVILGLTRRIMEMRVGTRTPLFISDGHSFWTRFDSPEGAYEWWGVYNFNQYLVEKANGIGVRLNRDSIPLRFDIPQTHAHVEGWRHVQPIYHMMHPETALYQLVVEDGGSYIAEGFVISSRPKDEHGENVRWKALTEDIGAQQFVESLSSAQ